MLLFCLPRHAGRGDAVRLAQTTPLATVSRQVPLASPLWAGLILFLLFFALPPVCPFGAEPAQAAPAGEQGTEPAPVPCFYSKSSYKKLPPKAQEVYAQLYEANMDFIKHGLANYYNTEDKSHARKIEDAKNFYEAKDCRAYGVAIDAHYTDGGGHQLAEISAKSRSDIQMLASLGQFPGPRPGYNTEIAYSNLFCDYQEEYNGRTQVSGLLLAVGKLR